MQALAEAVNTLIKTSVEELDQLMKLCYSKSFDKKSVISNDAKYIDEVYFITRGLMRVKINDLDGKDHTVHFALENQFISDYRAYLTGQKSRYQLEAPEKTETIVLPRSAISWG